ncbi:FkbM family methyltransferase [Bacteroidales bacterium OttesenSCG-928-I14]|nr:FkbM family methyltransferase [Bacteroidales bacterium OttesenSCG-928-I14]
MDRFLRLVRTFAFRAKHGENPFNLLLVILKWVSPSNFADLYYKKEAQTFTKRWLKQGEKDSYFDFNGALVADISNNEETTRLLRYVFDEEYTIPCFFNDDHSKSRIEYTSKRFHDERSEPYFYTDGNFDVTIKKNDIVIDCGAWIGDFSAYAASKGATSYAFEPTKFAHKTLCETARINEIYSKAHGKIVPVLKGLSKEEKTVAFNKSENYQTLFSIMVENKPDKEMDNLELTTLDKFVEENGLKSVDFIKADIEGSERDLLLGARNVLKTFAPKLALRIDHLPDDQYILKQIILEANPDYTVVQLQRKLYAAVIK